MAYFKSCNLIVQFLVKKALVGMYVISSYCFVICTYLTLTIKKNNLNNYLNFKEKSDLLVSYKVSFIYFL